MKLINLNKYIILIISSYLEEKTFLNIIKYNKALMNKLSITKYTYQKKYFYSIITPSLITTLLTNKSFFLKYFDEETIDKLKSDWENETTEIYKVKKKNFNFKNKTNNITDNELEKTTILNINEENLNIINEKNFTNLIELNLYKFNKIKIPISLLQNLEKLSIKKVNCLSLDYNEKEPIIFLNKLKYLYLDNVSFKINQKLKISTNNLIYFDLRFEDNAENKNYNFMVTMRDLINIFNFDFLSLFLFDEDITYFDILMNKTKDIKKKFKNSKEFFNQKAIIEKFNFFNFQIIYGVNNICGSYEENNKFLCRYIFSKTKNDKYFFKSFFQYETSGDYSNIKFMQEDYRLCNQRNYNDYFFIN